MRKLVLFILLLPAAFGLNCSECSIYQEGSLFCHTSGRDRLPCEGDFKVVKKYRAINDQTDLVTLSSLLGDLNMLNENFNGFFEYANKTMYIIQEWLPEEEDQTVDLSIKFAAIANLNYNITENGRAKYLAGIYSLDASDISWNETLQLNIANEIFKFTRKSNMTFEAKFNGSVIDVLGIGIAVRCKEVCEIDVYWAADTFSADTLFAKKEIVRGLADVNNMLKESASFYGRFYLVSSNYFNESLYSTKDLNADVNATQTLVMLNYLQQTYFMTLEMIGTILLEELQAQDIYYETDRLIITLNSKVEELQSIVNMYPAVKTLTPPKVFNTKGWSALDMDVFCSGLGNVSTCDPQNPREIFYCAAKGNTQIQVPSVTRESFDLEVSLDNNLSLLLRAKTGEQHAVTKQTFSYIPPGYEYSSSITLVGYLELDFDLFIVPKDALAVPYNIDPDFVLNFTYTKYTMWCNESAVEQKPKEEQVTMLFGTPTPAEIQTTENVFYGLQLFQQTSESFRYEIDGFDCFAKYSAPNYATNFSCNDTSYFDRGQTMSIWYGDEHWGSSAFGGITVFTGLPDYENITISSSGQAVASYSAQGNSDLSIGLYSPDDNDIINYLYTLDNRIGILQDEINSISDVLEELTKPEATSFWDYFNLAISVVDLADFAVNAAKCLYSLTRNSYKFLKGTTKSLEGNVAKEFASSLKSKQSSKGIYNPVDAINNGAIYNYFRGKSIKKLDDSQASIDKIVHNLDYYWHTAENGALTLTNDARLLMAHNSAAYSAMSKRVFSELAPEMKRKFRFDNSKTPFGEVSVYKSPIEIVAPIGGKFVSDNFPTSLTQGFLSNKATKYPFHTSFSSTTYEMNALSEPIIVRRYGGVAEASTVGPTNVKNPKVKIGIVKFDYTIKKAESGLTLELKNWDLTEKTVGNYYTKDDVDQLFKSFVSNKVYKKSANLDSNTKWAIIEYKTSQKYFTRNVIDSVAVSNPLYMKSLDRLFDYNTKYNGFNYNLWNRNCQSFVKAYASLASKGISSIQIADDSFRDFVKGFHNDFDKLFSDLDDYLTTRFTVDAVSFIDEVLSKAYYGEEL